MEKRIELEKRHRTPDQVLDLNLDNCKGCTAVEGLTDEFVNLRSLSLIGSGLTSLKGFPKLPKLKKLELSDNKISGGLQILKDCEKLYILNLSGNRIKELDTLKDLKELKNLRVLDLFNNEVTSADGYREKVFELLPHINYLDGTDRNGKEYEESDDDEDDGEDEEDGEEVPVKQNGKNISAEVGDSDDDEDGEEEEIDEDDSDNEVGLKDIYNDDLEDDDSDVYEEGEEEDDDDNDISDDSALEADGANNRARLTGNNSAGALDSTNNTEDGADGEEEDGEEEEDGGEEEEEGEDEEEEVEATSGKEAPRGTKRKLEEEEEGEPGGLN